jgi:hypothetical protein
MTRDGRHFLEVHPPSCSRRLWFERDDTAHGVTYYLTTQDDAKTRQNPLTQRLVKELNLEAAWQSAQPAKRSSPQPRRPPRRHRLSTTNRNLDLNIDD